MYNVVKGLKAGGGQLRCCLLQIAENLKSNEVKNTQKNLDISGSPEIG